MTETRKIFEESIESLEEGKLKDLLTAGLVGSSILMGNPLDAKSQTNFNKLAQNHEIVSKYEHGGKGNASVNKDNYGGYSYGKNQISTERRNGKPSTFDRFLKYLRDYDEGYAILLNLAGGHDAAFRGDPEFIDTWQNLANNKEDFNKIYDQFILDTQVIPTYKNMDASKDPDFDKITTWASENKAVQAAIQSAIVQHGSAGAQKIMKHVMAYYKPTTPRGFLHELYKYRAKKFPKLKSRYNDEGKDLKNYYDQLTKPLKTKNVKKSEPTVIRTPDIRELISKMPKKNKKKK